MARPKSAKILIRKGQDIHDFMWANVMRDGSVILGVSYEGKESLEVLFDKDFGELRPPKFT